METKKNELRIIAICLLLLSAIAIGAALKALADVIIPFVVAIFLTYCLTPVIDVQMFKFRFPRFVAIGNTVILAIAMLVLVVGVITSAVDEIKGSGDAYKNEIQKLIVSTAEKIPAHWLPMENGVEEKTQSSTPTEPTNDGQPIALSNAAESVAKAKDRKAEESAKKVTQLGDQLWKTTEGLIKGGIAGTASMVGNLLNNGMLVLIFMIFMLAGRKGPTGEPGDLLYDIEMQTKRYVVTMVVLSSVTGVLVGTTLGFLGVPFALMFGFFAFLLNFIPSIGSVVATLLPLPVVLLNPEMGMWAKVFALVIPMAIQFTIGNLIAPRMMGKSLNLHPVVVLLALIFFSYMWGIVGMFLATPFTAVLKILLDKFEYTRSVGALLAGELSVLAGKHEQKA